MSDEQAVRFACQGEELVGILGRPAAPRALGVVIVVGGPQYRTGSHRQFTLLARHLLQEGFAVLRFDCRGMGDSGGEFPGFEHISADIAAAVDTLCEHIPAVRRVVLWGATGVMALMLAGGWYYTQQQMQTGAPPTPQTPEPHHALPTPEETTQHEAQPVDPFAQEGAATGEAPVATETPVAQAGAATQPSVVAGPLAPRNVSLEQAAQSGNLVAQYELALQRLGSGRTREGVALLRAAADRGLVMAQYRMAKLYERGEGVTADLNTARQWTERAAAGGNRRAMHDLGVYFARGEGAPLDEAAAFRWFRQAAELGVADSQYNLGVLYQQGRGVTANPGEALFWFSVAARQGDQDAAARATSLETQVAATQMEQARARAQSFRPRAAIAVANGDFGPRPWAQRPAT